MYNIAFDLDDCLVDLFAEIKKIFKLNNKKYLPVIDWNFSNYPDDIKKQIYEMFQDPKRMCQLKTFSFAKILLKYLKSRGYCINIVTARHENIKQQTINFVYELFGIIPIVVNFGESKLEVLKKLKTDIYIDDCPLQLDTYMKNGIRCILISNKNTLYNWYIRDRLTWFENMKKLYFYFVEKEDF